MNNVNFKGVLTEVLEPGAIPHGASVRPDTANALRIPEAAAVSQAISMKRIADAMERIARSAPKKPFEAPDPLPGEDLDNYAARIQGHYTAWANGQ